MTDRTLRSPDDLQALRWNEAGLVPVVAQEAADGRLLMLAWANREALERALESGFMHYWSRSRGQLWRKGESSGNVQRLVSLHADCDADAVLARVRMEGPACHTGEATCFGELGDGAEGAGAGEVASAGAGDGAGGAGEGAGVPSSVLAALWEVLEARDRERPEGSWTTRLLADENLRLKKLGEETVELVTALVRGDERAPEEAADLVYHLMVALLGAGHSWTEVEQELERRR